RALKTALAAISADGTESAPAPATQMTNQFPLDEQDFREKFQATHRTMDGHVVRSRAEVMIDDWLYHHDVMHAYERKVPIEADLYTDFWIPKGRVYIEYWGMESNEKYAERKARKQQLYRE